MGQKNIKNDMNFSKLSIRQVAIRLQNGRLRPSGSQWDLDEALAVARLYKTRGELFTRNKPLYFYGYCNNLLDVICKNMKPGRKKNKYLQGVLNPAVALAGIFTSTSYQEFRLKHSRAYEILYHRGIDVSELFDNRDNAEYLKKVILELSQDNAARFVA